MTKILRYDQPGGSIPLSLKEAKRYLGYGKTDMPGDISQLLTAYMGQLPELLSPRACFCEVSVEIKDEWNIELGPIKIKSKDLCKNLYGCERAVIFAATIGHEIDSRIRKYSAAAPSKALIYQALGAMAIESWCDIINEKINGEKREAGYFPRPRFSPGYGDFALEHQRDIFELLDCPRNAGISLMESLIMSPSKSVTAVVGYSPAPGRPGGGCEECPAESCAYSREE